MKNEARVLLGRITGAHGLKGEIVVHAYTEYPEDIGAYGILSDGDGRREIELEVVRITEKGVIACAKGVNDRTQAEALKGMELWAPRERLPEVEDGAFYHADLIGLDAFAPDGRRVGKVVAVPNYGASDLLEVRLEGSRRTELIAFTEDFVPEVDIARRRVVVRLPGTDDEGTEGEADKKKDA